MENMSASLGIVICTYNNKDLVLDCLASIKNNGFKDYQIYLVDNASTDGTYDAVNERYMNNHEVQIIRNEENLGCSGGFDTGIRMAYKKGHKYIACFDSDIKLQEDAIEVLYNYLESNQDVVVAGSRVMFMDQPDVIQWIGSRVVYGEPFDKVFKMNELEKKYYPKDLLYFGAVFEGQGKRFENDLDEVIECDLLPACAYMFRSEVIKKVGFWDRSYFLYWDETDWQKRVKEAGGRLVCCTNSVIWHKNGSFKPTNTRALYYGARNVVRFFGKYVEKDKLDALAKYLLWSNFQLIYPSNYKKLDGVIRTVMIAINDALKGIDGKCLEGRVFDRNVDETDLLQNALNNSNKVLLALHKSYPSDMEKRLLFDMVIRILRKKEVKIYIKTNLSNQEKEYFNGRAEFVSDTSGQYDLKMKLCAHVNVDLPCYEEGWSIVDSASNFVDSIEGWRYFKNYKNMLHLFYVEHKDEMTERLKAYHEMANA